MIDKKINSEEISIDELPGEVRGLLDRARASFDVQGELPPAVRVWNKAGAVLNLPAAQFFRNRQTKRELEKLLLSAVRGGAIAIAIMTEAWSIELPVAKDSDSESAREASRIAEELVKRLAQEGKLSEYPGRYEQVTIFYENEENHFMCAARISREKDAPPKMLDWSVYRVPQFKPDDTEGLADAGSFQGIFARARRVKSV